MSVSCECVVVTSISVCNGLIPRPEKSYRVCVSFSVIMCNDNLLHLQIVGSSRQTKKHNIQDNEVQLRGKI